MIDTIKKIGNRFFLLPYNFFTFIIIQFLLVIFFNKQLYQQYSSNFYDFFTQYFFWSIILLFIFIIWLCLKNFKYIKRLVFNDKFFILFLIFALFALAYLIWRGPILVRVDKELGTIRSINSFDSGIFWSPNIGALGLLFGIAKARGYFFLLSFFSYIFPITIKSIFFISSGLFFLQSLLFYFISRLLIKNNWIALFTSLLFLLHPNNFLLGSAPDYVFAGQVFGVFSHLTLLLFIKYKERSIFVLSLCLLLFSLLLRIEMIFWLPVYFFLAWRLLGKEEIVRNKWLINIFLLIGLPLVFSTILGFFVKPIGSLAVMDLDFTEIINGSVLLKKIIPYYLDVFLKHFSYNINYLFSYIPLIWVLLPVIYFYKKKEVQNYFFYALFFFLIITTLHYTEYIDSFNYLSYVITPLIILWGLILDNFFGGKKLGYIFAGLLLIILGSLNFLCYKPAWLFTDFETIVWNKEYNILERYIKEIKSDSALISIDEMSLVEGMLDKKRDILERKINIIPAEKDLVLQIDELRKKYQNVYIIQGTMGSFRKNLTVFSSQDSRSIIDARFTYEVIFDEFLEAEKPRKFFEYPSMGGKYSERIETFACRILSEK